MKSLSPKAPIHNGPQRTDSTKTSTGWFAGTRCVTPLCCSIQGHIIHPSKTDIKSCLTGDNVTENAYPRLTGCDDGSVCRSEEHTSELQSLMPISSAVFCL